MKDIKIKYNETWGTKHSRDYYRGLSFHFAGKWCPGVHYVSDDYIIDFVTINNCLLACAKSHLSLNDNKPTEFKTDSIGNVIGIISNCWDFVCAGVKGASVGVRFNENTNELEYCEDTTAEEPEWEPIVRIPEVLQELGESEIDPVSQKVVTEAIEDVKAYIDSRTFIADYNQRTPQSDIYAAYQAGKYIYAIRDNRIWALLGCNETASYFGIVSHPGPGYPATFSVASIGWSDIIFKNYEQETNKAVSLDDPNNIKYPTTQAVVNALSSKIDSMTNITWNELKIKRDNSQLVPGQQYRIIDYITISGHIGTQSAGHQFDVIVIADSTNKLNECAKAVQHVEDTYFTNNNLAAWKLWYCLDNDTNRFTWADSANGKGVIYRMIDEFENDVPYDFKNIQFKRKLTDGSYDPEGGEDEWVYTFGIDNDCSLNVSSLLVYGNIIKNCYFVDDRQILNNIVFLCESTSNCCFNTFDFGCENNTFGHGCYQNTFGKNCDNNVFGNNCCQNTFGNESWNNKFVRSCYHNTFGDESKNNKFDVNCNHNTLGNNCYNNTIGRSCSCNTFGNNCHDNEFRTYCYYNTFGNNCNDNIIGRYGDQYIIERMTFEDNCYNLTVIADFSGNKNVRFVQGTQNSYIEIPDYIRDKNYETKVAKNSREEVVMYCEADLVYVESHYYYNNDVIG